MNSYQVHAWYYPNFYTFSDILNGKRCKISISSDTSNINNYLELEIEIEIEIEK